MSRPSKFEFCLQDEGWQQSKGFAGLASHGCRYLNMAVPPQCISCRPNYGFQLLGQAAEAAANTGTHLKLLSLM